MKHLLPQTPYFKTNLHTHTTISDGKLSPEEVKALYKSKGYQVLCITDHNIIVDHSNMNEPDFLMLTGMEINLNQETYRPRLDGKTYHFNLISKRPDQRWSPGKVHGKFPGGLEYEKNMICEEMDYSHTPEAANAVIAKANEMGFLVMYNHPTWSCHSYLDYTPLKGLWGMELRNSECCLLGINENNFRVFKDISNSGNKIYPLGTDDLHGARAAGLSWIMVGASQLDYDSVIAALEKGDFYMSCGPEISSLSIDGNILKITCSDAKAITLECTGRFSRRAVADEGSVIREAEFDLTVFKERTYGDPSMYVYLTVTAADGTYAATRAYYLDEL